MNHILIKAGGGALATAAAYGCYLLGGWDVAIRILFLFMLLDYVSGLLCGFLRKSPKTEGGGFLSSVAFQGLTRKLMMVAVVILAAGLDRLLGTDGLCRLAAIGFYTANEGLSIVENLALLGVPFPNGLKRVLTVLRQRSDAAAPGAEGPAPADIPTADIHTANIQTADIPSVNILSADTLSADIPTADIPSVNTSTADIPSADTPSANIPTADNPSANTPLADPPSAVDAPKDAHG